MAWWDEISERIGRLLPAQGPVSVFIHHNTLHAFEGLNFEDAVIAAGEKFSCEPFLSEEEYRREFKRGRILESDLDWVLRQELGDSSGRVVCADFSSLTLRTCVARYGIPEAAGAPLNWLLQETPALRHWRGDIPATARKLLARSENSNEENSVRALWDVCLGFARELKPAPAPQATFPIRHRDLLLAAARLDSDTWTHPLLIRFLGSFLDQGLARWIKPGPRGLYASFLDLYSHSWTSLCGSWARLLPDLIHEEKRLDLSAPDSIQRSLDILGVAMDERADFLEKTALALRGWAGMIWQIEKRPDRVPARTPNASLADYLAIHLLLDRAALAYAAKSLPGFNGELKSLRDHLRSLIEPVPPPLDEERAWSLFHAAQLLGLSAARVKALGNEEIASLADELDNFRGVAIRRVLHSAYERRLRARVYDALSAREPSKETRAPAFQAIFCLDDREESFRRHLEEVAPEAETLGTAGFFGVAMYYQGSTDAHPRPLCPIAIQPRHYVGEVKNDPSSRLARFWRLRRRGSGNLGKTLHHFNGMIIGGFFASLIGGPISLMSLVLRVVFPGLFSRWAGFSPFSRTPVTQLLLDRRLGAPPLGEFFGYTKEEMAKIVGDVLRDIGIAERLAPLVIVLGHGSSSLNNPHKSAYDCGACGGGRGGPNARAFAQMTNDPAVREILAQEGLRLPRGAWFIGAQRNTSDNSVDFFDLDLLPQEHEALFNRIAIAFAHTRRREAHERCRRFESFPLSGGRGAALAHVEARAHDLSQPRPEYGHTTNAFCVIGRRERTRGLFLDRRAFLVSYDPTKDDDGAILERTLAAVIPVVAGISLEYYFSRVDNSGYGCGTKLPHNVACLLGVMDGAQSDLRTGLPWQMVEIHEPTRLLIVTESLPDSLDRVLSRLPDIRNLMDRRWLFAACLDPKSKALWFRERQKWIPWAPESPLPSAVGNSSDWYREKRDHLPIAEILLLRRDG